MVQTQDIRRIILLLDCGKAGVVHSVRRAHQFLARFTKLVYISSLGARLLAADALDGIRRANNRVYVRGYEARVLLDYGQALLGAGSPEQALPLLQDAVTRHHDLYDSGSSVLVAGADLALARCLAALGRGSEALAWIAEAAAIFDRHAALGVHWRRLLESARAALPRSAALTDKRPTKI